MKLIIEKSKYLVLVSIIALLITFAFSLFWGVVKSFDTWMVIINTAGHSPDITLKLIKVVDSFLISLVLYLLAASIYSMMIGSLDLSDSLVARSLPELKSKLSSIMVLVIAIHFIEVLFTQEVDGLNLLYNAVASTLVAGALIAFTAIGTKNSDH